MIKFNYRELQELRAITSLEIKRVETLPKPNRHRLKRLCEMHGKVMAELLITDSKTPQGR